ncbi:F-box/LRR-repeat protein 12-like [Rutidosis leptorrhynchoides]|uniref:F-box/LRR-repeat protein 12-like n=1 Tax=Rutidosis leptorrhynchoides TaxID=125765 RepID=UPI003A992CFA
MDVNSEDGKQGLCLITQLPDDLLSLIYRKLFRVSHERSFRRTCRRFLYAAILSCECLDDVKTSTVLRNSYNRCESIVLGECLKRYMHFGSPPYMAALQLSFATITDNGLETLTKYANKLLTNVSLIGCQNVTDTGISLLKQNCPQLRALKMFSCIKVVGVRSEQGFSSTLTYLEADSHVLYPNGLLSGGGLEYLQVYHCGYLNENQRRLAAIGCAAIGSGIAKNLKILTFSKLFFVMDDCIIMKISKGCPYLQELSFDCCSGIGLPDWVSIGSNCQNLERLHVNKSGDLCDRGLLALGNGCKLLSVLYMTDCPKVTSQGKECFKIQRADVRILQIMGKEGFPTWTRV